jgi:hypothetical protein
MVGRCLVNDVICRYLGPLHRYDEYGMQYSTLGDERTLDLE